MSKFSMLLLCFIVALTANAQTKFLEGYFITDSGERIDCLIHNEDWRKNPTAFEYKLNASDVVKTGTLKTAREFVVPNVFKYERHTVQLDSWSEPGNKAYLDENSQPDYKEETLFLKVLVEGEASLFQFDGSGIKFFFSLNEETPQQLFFKRYKKQGNQIAENNQYRQQIYNGLSCEDMDRSEASKTDYDRKDLINYFEKYNICKNADFKILEEKKSSSEFNLTVRPGVDFSTFDLESRIGSSFGTEFETETNFRIGLEAEFVLDFNNNKWSIFIEPTYRASESEKIVPFRSSTIDSQKITVTYSSIQIPVGVRHYLFLNDSSKIFINAAFVYDFVSDSVIDWEVAPTRDRDFRTRSNLAFGVGYKYGKRLSAEFRLYTDRGIIPDTNEFTGTFKQSTLILGYTLF